MAGASRDTRASRSTRLGSGRAILAALGAALGCAAPRTVAGERAAFAPFGSSLLAVARGPSATVHRTRDLAPLWSRAFPVSAPDRLHAAPSPSGRLLVAWTGRRTWVAAPGAELLDLAFDRDEQAFDPPGAPPRALHALSPDERLLALAWQRTLQLYRLDASGGPALRLELPLPAPLADYPRCPGGEPDLCGVLSVSFSADGAALLVLHRPSREETAASLLLLGGAPRFVEVPVRRDLRGRAWFFGASSAVVLERFGALRLFSAGGAPTGPEEGPFASGLGASERELPGAPGPDGCLAPDSAFARAAPFALCASGAEALLWDLRAGRVAARAPFPASPPLLLAAVPGGAVLPPLVAAGEARALFVAPASGDVFLLRAGATAFEKRGSIGPRVVIERGRAVAPLPASAADDARALLFAAGADRIGFVAVE